MHGTEHGIPERRTIRLSAPRPLGLATAGLTLPGAPQLLSGTGPHARNGLSLARNGSRLHGLHSGVNVPGLLLRVNARRSPCPFGPSAPLPQPVRPGQGRFIASCPLQFFQPATPAAPPASTPRWEFCLPPDQSVQPDLPPLGPPSESARSPLTPSSPVLSLDYDCGSSFAIRYVSGGLLFLKPLGTSITMPEKPLSVNPFYGRFDTFPHNISAVF